MRKFYSKIAKHHHHKKKRVFKWSNCLTHAKMHNKLNCSATSIHRSFSCGSIPSDKTKVPPLFLFFFCRGFCLLLHSVWVTSTEFVLRSQQWLSVRPPRVHSLPGHLGTVMSIAFGLMAHIITPPPHTHPPNLLFKSNISYSQRLVLIVLTMWKPKMSGTLHSFCILSVRLSEKSLLDAVLTSPHRWSARTPPLKRCLTHRSL